MLKRDDWVLKKRIEEAVEGRDVKGIIDWHKAYQKKMGWIIAIFYVLAVFGIIFGATSYLQEGNQEALKDKYYEQRNTIAESLCEEKFSEGFSLVVNKDEKLIIECDSHRFAITKDGENNGA